MEYNELRTIIKDFNESGIQELSLKHGSTSLKLIKSATQPIVQSTLPQSMMKQEDAKKPSAIVANNPIVDVLTVASTESLKIANTKEITSPMVGTFYSSSSPSASPYVSLGTTVTTGDTVCIVEAMKLFNEIEADFDGEVIEILAESGQLVEYGQPLFVIKTK